MDSIIVRPARPSDFEAIRDLFGELDRYHAAGEPGLLRVPSVPRPDRGELNELIGCDTCFLAVSIILLSTSRSKGKGSGAS